MTRLIKPLTDKELEIAELVGAGHRGRKLLSALADRGQHIAASTLETRIRDISRKMDNPYGLPPRSIITLWATTRDAA